MNTLIKLITTFIIMLLSHFVKANDRNIGLTPTTCEGVITNYIDIIEHGNTESASNLFTTDFQHIIQTPFQIKKITKQDYLSQLKKQGKYEMICQSSYQTLDKNNQVSMVKVSIQFQNFSRVDYLTLIQKKDGWQIKQINTSYPN